MTLVSIIIPCYNEVNTIAALLDALYQQTFDHNQLEVVIADGGSTDGTRAAIQRWLAAHPDFTVRVVENPARTIPAGLNTAIRAAQGEIIIRMDAHSIPAPDYVRRCVDLLESGRGDNVGGRWEIRPGADTWIARGIARAAGHPLGAGDARYRHSEKAGAVDTVPFGAFYRSLIDRVGWFDETLLTNEDYEFNVRVRKLGGTIWFDPAIRTTYIARATLGDLAAQYYRYGYWKARMLYRYPSTLRWRQALPPLFVAGLVGGLLLWPLPLPRLIFLLVVGLYGLILTLAGLRLAWRKRDLGLILSFPLAIATMHLAWGFGFWVSLLGYQIERWSELRDRGW